MKSEETGIRASSGKDDNEDSKVIFGEDDPFAVNKDVYIAVTGGTVFIYADEGLCLKSDGDLYVTGGTVTVDGFLAGDGGTISFDGTAYVTGGTVENKAEGIVINNDIMNLNNK